jgi:hypothetical protein
MHTWLLSLCVSQNVHTQIHIHTYIYIHTCTYTKIHACIHTHTYIHTYITQDLSVVHGRAALHSFYIHIHTYTYIHTLHRISPLCRAWPSRLAFILHIHTYTYIHTYITQDLSIVSRIAEPPCILKTVRHSEGNSDYGFMFDIQAHQTPGMCMCMCMCVCVCVQYAFTYFPQNSACITSKGSSEYRFMP